MRIGWNTGALYTLCGQRIAAQVIGQTVIFVDIDRCVDGQFPIARAPLDAHRLQLLVQASYDSGNYSFVDYEARIALGKWAQANIPTEPRDNRIIEERTP